MTATTDAPSHRWRAYLRLLGLAGLLVACLPPHLLARIATGKSDWPRRFLGGAAHIAGVRAKLEGMEPGAHCFIVANHVSWLDILILGSTTGAAFVSKAEVKRTPLIGWLADQHRTIYVDRSDRGDAHGQIRRIGEALEHPQPMAVFPEGTTGNGRALLPFRTTLLHAVAPPPPGATVLPVAIDYHEATAHIAWIEGEPGVTNALRILGRKGRTKVTVRVLDALPPHSDRKRLASEARSAIETALFRTADITPIGAAK